MDTAVILAVVVGLTEVFKRTTGLNGRFVPLFALILGVGVSFVANLGGPAEIVLGGIIIGLTAVGCYEVGKTTILGK